MESSTPNCLITGTSRGIGRALVEVALASGANVTTLGTSPMADFPTVESRIVDLRDTARVAGTMADLPVDRLDILINNAGVFLDPDEGLEGLDPEKVRDTYLVNVIGAMEVTKGALPYLKGSKKARVLNISSAMGSMNLTKDSGSYAYRMSKAALNMFSVGLATEFPDIRVLSIHPGWVKTEMGGPKAPLETGPSAAGIWKLAQEPPTEGIFFDYEGKALPW